MTGKKKKQILSKKLNQLVVPSSSFQKLKVKKEQDKTLLRQTSFFLLRLMLLLPLSACDAVFFQTILVCSRHWLALRLRCGQLKLGPLQEMVIGHFAGHLNRQRVVETRLVKFAMFINTQKATRFKTKDAKCLARVQG